MLEEDLTSSLKDLENNQQLHAGMGKELEEWRSVTRPIVEYIAPAPAEGEDVIHDERPLLDKLRAAPDAMRAVERSSARECVVRALSTLRLHYPLVDMQRFINSS